MKKITYKIESDQFDQELNTFTVKEGETYFIIGQNGVGKSSLIDALNYGNSPYSISYEINISVTDVKEYFSSIKLKESVKDKILDKFVPGKAVVYLSGDNSDSQLSRISKEFARKIWEIEEEVIKATREAIYSEINRVQSKISNSIKLINATLNKKYKVSELREWLIYLDSQAPRTISDLKEFKGELRVFKNQLKRMNRENLNEYIFGDRSFFLREPYISGLSVDNKEFESMYKKYKFENDIKKIKDLQSGISQIAYSTNGGYSNDGNINNIAHKKNILFNKKETRFRWYPPKELDNSTTKRIEKTLGYTLSDGVWVNKHKVRLSKGELLMLEHCIDIFTDVSGRAKAYDEPFNSLDWENIRIFKEALSNEKTTNIISTHQADSIDLEDLDNMLIMWMDGDKRKIINFDRLSSVKTSIPKESFMKIEQAMVNWALEKKYSKILLVEGRDDKKALAQYLDPEINIVSFSGTDNFQPLATAFVTKFKNVLFLADNDMNGKKASNKYSVMFGIENNVTKEVYKLTQDKDLNTLEKLISKELVKKRGLKVSLDKTKAIKIKKQICKIIEDRFNKKA